MVSNIFILDKHLVTKKALTINGQHTFFDDLYKQDLSTGTESYEFSTNYYDIDEQDYIMFRYHKQYKLFQITEIEQSHYDGKIITTVYGESVCLELLNGAVRATTLENCNIKTFLEYVLADTDWSYKYSATLKDKYITVKIDKTTQIWTVIQDYMSEFGYEINTRVKYEDGRATAKIIEFYAEEELGNKTYKRFEYSRNVKGIVKKKDIYDFCTALIIESNHEVIGTGLSYNADGYTKKDDSDVVFATKENKTYNSGRDYIYGVYEDNDSDSAGEAIENAVAELKRRATPKFDYEVNTALTYEEYEDVSIGDTVYVIDHSFNPILTLEARIGALEISFTDRNNCNCNLTNYKEVKSGINPTLTGNVKTIIDTYFPLSGEKIAGGAIDKDHINVETYDIIMADSVRAVEGVFETLIAESAYIKNIEANKIDVNTADIGKLNADVANIKDLKADKADIEELEAKYADIENLKADKADIEELEAKYADIENLKADKAEIETLKAKDADIENLKADKAQVGILEAGLAKINTLITGNEIVDSSAVIHLTADNAIIDNAVIKDAMIESVSAGKINAGTINTNLVNIASDTGGVSISKETMQFKDENNTVRIQIGRDTNNNFTFALYDSTGKGQLINENGIQSSDAIADGLIRNDHIDDNAAISGTKLDISSVYDEMNEDGSKTLKASKIYLNDKQQTLEVGFNSMTTKVDGNTTAINTNTTNIDIANGKINALITSTEKLEGDTNSLSSSYNSIKNTVDSHTQSIGNITITVNGISSKQAEFEQSLNGFKTTVTNDYATKDELTGEVTELESSMSSIEQTADKINWLVKSGDSSSNMVLTDKLYQLTTDKAMIEAKKIELNGSIDINNGTFTVDTKGNMTAKSGTFNGSIVGSSINIGPRDGETYENGNQVYSFSVSTAGNLEIGGAGRQEIDSYPRSAFEITPNGNLYSVSNTAGLYTKLSAGQLTCYGPLDANGQRNAYTKITSGAIDAINATIECQSLSADTEISTDTLTVDHINNKAYPKTITSGATLHIGAWTRKVTENGVEVEKTTQPNDDDDYKDDAVYSSIATALSKIPKNLNGKTVRIQLEKSITEDVSFNSFSTGNLYLCFNGKTLYGYVYCNNCSASVYLVGGSDSDTDASTGTIRPQGVGIECASRTCALGVNRCQYVSFQWMKIYAPKTYINKDYPLLHCVGAQGASNIYVRDVKIVNADVGFRSASMSQIHAYSSEGTATDTAWYSTSGAKISLAGNKQAGGKKNNTAKDEAGQIWTDSTTSYDGTQQTDTSTPTVPEKVTKTVTYKADYADTYRHSVYNSWKKDGTARQGDWGYGDCAGYWFFGDDFANIRSKAVSKIEITITRQSSSNGNNSAVEHKLVTHTYKSRPSGAPSTSGTTIGTLSLSRGQTKTLTITDSSIITAIKNGRGFAIRHSYDSSHYSVCSGSAKIKFTYKE